MPIEYVRLSDTEQLYGEKILLESQLSLASLLKKVKSYHKTRNEELLLKIALKKKLDEAKNDIKILEKLLPKVKSPEEEKTKIQKAKPSSIESEIAELKRKLAKFQ